MHCRNCNSIHGLQAVRHSSQYRQIGQQLRQKNNSTDPNLVKNQRKLRTLDQKIDHLEAAYNQFDLGVTLQQVEDSRFEIIKNPANAVALYWPRPHLLFALGLVAGGILWFFWELIITPGPRKLIRAGQSKVAGGVPP